MSQSLVEQTAAFVPPRPPEVSALAEQIWTGTAKSDLPREPAVPPADCYGDMDGWAIGRLGERLVAGQLALFKAAVKAGGAADLVVNGLTVVEVKTSRWRPYQRRGTLAYQFCLEREGHAHFEADFLVLVPLPADVIDWLRKPAAFIIPAEAINGDKKITIPSQHPADYAGRWSEWFNAWDLLLK